MIYKVSWYFGGQKEKCQERYLAEYIGTHGLGKQSGAHLAFGEFPWISQYPIAIHQDIRPLVGFPYWQDYSPVHSISYF